MLEVGKPGWVGQAPLLRRSERRRQRRYAGCSARARRRSPPAPRLHCRWGRPARTPLPRRSPCATVRKTFLAWNDLWSRCAASASRARCS